MKIIPHVTLVPTWNHELVSAWLAFAAQSDCHKNLNRLGDALDLALRICRPAGSFGALRAHADEIRQNAHILLLHGEGVFSRHRRRKPRKSYLDGNKALHDATAQGDGLEVHRQLLRSIHGAANQCCWRLRRSLARAQMRQVRLDEVAEEKLGVCRHASELEPAQLSFEARREFILDLLREASSLMLFPAEALALAVRIYGGCCRSADAARDLGVSPAAISQRLKPIRKWLTRQHPSLEVPFA